MFFLHFSCVADDESGEKAVSVLLNGEESELVFIDHSTAEMSVSAVYYAKTTINVDINPNNNNFDIKKIWALEFIYFFFCMYNK